MPDVANLAKEALALGRGPGLQVEVEETIRAALRQQLAFIKERAQTKAKVFGSVSGLGLESFLKDLESIPKP